MKKLIFFTMLTLAGATVFASDEKKPTDGSKSISYNALNQFEVEFANAKNVQWTYSQQLQKATFFLNGEKVTAFYNTTGDYLGATKFIAVEQLPEKAKADLAKKYGEYTLSYAIQVISRPANTEVADDTGSYWIDLTHEGREFYAKAAASGTLESVKEIVQ